MSRVEESHLVKGILLFKTTSLNKHVYSHSNNILLILGGYK